MRLTMFGVGIAILAIAWMWMGLTGKIVMIRGW
jgi:hypothetical protein